jgi:hypothetical protein
MSEHKAKTGRQHHRGQKRLRLAVLINQLIELAV